MQSNDLFKSMHKSRLCSVMGMRRSPQKRLEHKHLVPRSTISRTKGTAVAAAVWGDDATQQASAARAVISWETGLLVLMDYLVLGKFHILL